MCVPVEGVTETHINGFPGTAGQEVEPHGFILGFNGPEDQLGTVFECNRLDIFLRIGAKDEMAVRF